MSRRDDGCVFLPFLLIWFLAKIAIALCAYGLAAMMTLATIIWLPLIALVALFKGDGDMIFMSLAMWFALAHEFVTEKLFG